MQGTKKIQVKKVSKLHHPTGWKPSPAPRGRINRREALTFLGAGASAIALAGCVNGGLAQTSASPVLPADELLDDIAWKLLYRQPTRATGLGVDTGEHADLRARMEDPSPAGQTALAAMLREDLARVRAVDKAGLDPATVTSLEVVESAYATALDGFAQPYGDVAIGSWRNAPYIVIQNVGAYLDLPRFFDSDHPVRNAADAEAYLARLAQVPAMLNGELERMRSATAMGVIPPAFLLDKAIPQMESTLADAAAGGALVESLTRRTGDIPGNWGERARVIVTGSIAPAFQAQLDELKRQRGLATQDAGIWARPGGDAYYAWALRASTTTTMTPDEIHEAGKAELARLHERMDGILRTLGYEDGGVGERMIALSEDPRFQFSEGDKGRAEIMEFIQQRVDWIKAQMPRAFRTLVDGNLEVRRIPVSEEAGAPSAYGGSGSIDGSIPGKMWINLRSTDLHRKYDLPTLVHHETIPGHVWEGEYSNRLPLIRSILAFNAFSEGWAIYAEQLADELGAYKGDPAGELGYLQNQAYRACRMVLDTGLHAKRWSRQQAIDYFREQVGLSLDETTAEIDRYCSWPGQACGYMVGRLEIVRLREQAMAALGSAYDLRDFDNAVVGGGNSPLDVLAKNVDRYIARTRG